MKTNASNQQNILVVGSIHGVILSTTEHLVSKVIRIVKNITIIPKKIAVQEYIQSNIMRNNYFCNLIKFTKRSMKKSNE